jgi:hypothetical protein
MMNHEKLIIRGLDVRKIRDPVMRETVRLMLESDLDELKEMCAKTPPSVSEAALRRLFPERYADTAA